MTFDEWWEANKDNLYQDAHSHDAARRAWAWATPHAQPAEERRSEGPKEEALRVANRSLKGGGIKLSEIDLLCREIQRWYVSAGRTDGPHGE